MSRMSEFKTRLNAAKGRITSEPGAAWSDAQVMIEPVMREIIVLVIQRHPDKERIKELNALQQKLGKGLFLHNLGLGTLISFWSGGGIPERWKELGYAGHELISSYPFRKFSIDRNPGTHHAAIPSPEALTLYVGGLLEIVEAVLACTEAGRGVAQSTVVLEAGNALQDASKATERANEKSQQRHPLEAEPLYKRALKLRESALGPDHPETGASLNNLAKCYDSQARYSEAEPLYKRALKLRESALGPDHWDTMASLNNLATCYNSQGRYSEAEPLFKRALRINESPWAQTIRIRQHR